MPDMLTALKDNFNANIQTTITAADTVIDDIHRAGEIMVKSLLNNHKFLICGNGGSASIAQRFSANMLNRYSEQRPSLPAISLSCNPTTLTGIATDNHFSQVFSKQIKALGQTGDVLVVISATGNSNNTLEAVETAHNRDIKVVAITGGDGGELALILDTDDVEIRVPSDHYPRIQEIQLVIIHSLCDMIERSLFATTE